MTGRIVFSTADVPSHRRFAVWRETLGTLNRPVVLTPVVANQEQDDAPFDGAVWSVVSPGVV